MQQALPVAKLLPDEDIRGVVTSPLEAPAESGSPPPNSASPPCWGIIYISIYPGCQVSVEFRTR